MDNWSKKSNVVIVEKTDTDIEIWLKILILNTKY